MPEVNVYLNHSNCGGNSNSITKTTETGVEFRKGGNPVNTGAGLEIGDIGTNAILSDGSHMLSGVYNGNGVNELDPLSWDNIITN